MRKIEVLEKYKVKMTLILIGNSKVSQRRQVSKGRNKGEGTSQAKRQKWGDTGCPGTDDAFVILIFQTVFSQSTIEMV